MTTITKTQCLDLIDSLADKTLSFGCVIKAYTIGVWMHRANLYFYRVTDEMSLDENSIGQKRSYCGFDPWGKVRLSACGFQTYLQGWRKRGSYPKTIEVYTDMLGKNYKVTELSDVFDGKLEILGHDILIGGVLEAYSQMLERKPIEDKLAEAKAFAEKNLPRYAPASEDPNHVVNQVFKIASLWEECLDPKDARSKTGFKRSLQSIFEDIEWEVIAMNPTRADRSIAEVAKPSPATDLFIFLISLNLKK